MAFGSPGKAHPRFVILPALDRYWISFLGTSRYNLSPFIPERKDPVPYKLSDLKLNKIKEINDKKKDLYKNEAESAVREIFEHKIFGNAGNKLIVEEFLEGEEASIFAITDGENFICLPAAQDHKRIGDGDTGKNTGGMGAYAPASIMTKELSEEIENKIIKPVLNEMIKTGNKFIGCLYAGLIITKSGPKVIEFNCRFGDPETQVVLPILEGDFLELLYSAAVGNIKLEAVKYSGGCSVCVVAASNGYPDDYEKGFVIDGLENKFDDVIIYHAGTKKELNNVVTNGGRVLGVTSVLKSFDLKIAKEKAYNAINQIHFDGIYFRKDISDKAYKHLE
jgi:phosphoribosylamine--glycine ligase